MAQFRSLVANLLTLTNLMCGVLAILVSFTTSSTTLPILLIVAAAFCDLWDGWAARLLHASSSIGADLDSLADLVSFGVAPAFMIYLPLMQMHGMWLALPVLLIVPFAAYRLAKFNNDDRQTEGFLGLPVPSNAFFWVGYYALLFHYDLWVSRTILVITIVLTLLFGFLMVSELPMLSLKEIQKIPLKKWVRSPKIIPIVLILGHTIPALIIWKWGGLAVGILFYITLSITREIAKRYRR